MTYRLITAKGKNIMLLGFVAVIIAMGGYYYVTSMPAGGLNACRDASLTIKNGQTLASAADELEEKAIIGNRSLLVQLVSLIGSANNVKAGHYDFTNNRSYVAIARLLLQGSNAPIKVTFPEGLNYRQMAGLAQRELAVDSFEFSQACRDKSIIAAHDIKSEDLEGYLFPDTYYFYFGADAKLIINAMVDRFFDIFDDSMKAKARKVNFSIHQVVTLASLIEKETALMDERYLISAVFQNRLKLGMPLQCDPTVIYALPPLSRPLLMKDLELKSPYNTYLNYSLPPGPIANPGKSSLDAALNPAKVPYLYFVASGEGGHLFAMTNEEQNENRARAKQKSKPR